MSFQVSVTFAADALNAESRDAFALAYGWTGATDPRGATKTAFRDYCVKHYIKEVVRMERAKALQAAVIVSPVAD